MPSGAYPAAATLALTPSIDFSISHTPHNTPTSIFGLSGATTKSPRLRVTALPVSFGIAPTPSFQFGSTAANTLKLGHVNTTATTTAMASTKSDSFGAAANSINLFGNIGVSSSFGSQSLASTMFGSLNGNENALAPHAVLNSSNSFGTTINTPSQLAATSLFGSAATPIARHGFIREQNTSKCYDSFWRNSVSSLSGETQFNPFGGGTVTGTQTNSSNPLGAVTSSSFGGVSYNSGSAPIGGVNTAPKPGFGGSGASLFGNTGSAMTTPASLGGVTQNATNPFGNPSLNSFGSSTVSLGGDVPFNVGVTGSNIARPRQLRRMKR